MRIIVSDSSCFIELRKASLLDAFLSLPYEILIPNILLEDEPAALTSAQKRALIDNGLKVIDLPGACVLRAQELVREAPQLSISDGFAFALAENRVGSILLTADETLQVLAAGHRMEVRDVLWVVDEVHENALAGAEVLHKALLALADDHATRLPRRDLAAYIRRYDGLR